MPLPLPFLIAAIICAPANYRVVHLVIFTSSAIYSKAKTKLSQSQKRKISNLLQADHFCRLKGSHQVGLDCLSDEQVLPILMHMDVDTLLHCSRYTR